MHFIFQSIILQLVIFNPSLFRVDVRRAGISLDPAHRVAMFEDDHVILICEHLKGWLTHVRQLSAILNPDIIIVERIIFPSIWRFHRKILLFNPVIRMILSVIFPEKAQHIALPGDFINKPACTSKPYSFPCTVMKKNYSGHLFSIDNQALEAVYGKF